MNKEKATKIVNDCRAFRARWGRMAGDSALGDYTVDDLVQALELLDDSISEQGGLFGQERAKLNRQLGAAKARETKLKKRVKHLEGEVEAVIEEYRDFKDTHNPSK